MVSSDLEGEERSIEGISHLEGQEPHVSASFYLVLFGTH